MKVSALTAFLLPIFVCGCKTARNNPWPLVTTPTGNNQVAQTIGGYSAGCLIGGESLPPDGIGYQVMRITRRRFYGHPSLIHFIKNLGKKVKTKNHSVVLVGDIGQPRGGPTNSNHRSHQNGLDVDIWFRQMPEARVRSLTLDEREELSAPSMVSRDGTMNVHFWSQDQVNMLKETAEFDDVDRIFVSPFIKRSLCNETELAQSPWLRKLRPWWGHQDHFHVRLKCPNDQKECTSQPPLPAGNGCDETLDWWFSPEAQEKSKTEEKEVIPPLPILPDSCEKVLHM